MMKNFMTEVAAVEISEKTEKERKIFHVELRELSNCCRWQRRPQIHAIYLPKIGKPSNSSWNNFGKI